MKKGITFDCGGNIYQLRFSINNLCKIEDLMGKPISALQEGNVGMKDMRILLACAIVPAISLEGAGDLMEEIMEERGLEGLSKLIIDGLDKSLDIGKSAKVEANEMIKDLHKKKLEE